MRPIWKVCAFRVLDGVTVLLAALLSLSGHELAARTVEQADIESAIARLQSDDPVTRANAAVSLAAIGPKAAAAVPLLVKLLGDETPLERRSLTAAQGSGDRTTPGREAATALVKIGEPSVLPLISALEDSATAGTAMAALGGIKDSRALEPLLRMLESPTHGYGAAVALGELGDPRAVGPLVDSLRNEDSRYGAMRALGKLKAAAAVEPLLAMLDWPFSPRFNDSQRSMVIDTLGAIGDLRATMPLLSLMARSSVPMRQGIIGALSRLADPRAAAAVVAALKDPDERLQNAAEYGFLNVAPKYGCDPLLGLLSDPDPGIRRRAVLGLEKMSQKLFGSDKDRWQKWCDENR